MVTVVGSYNVGLFLKGNAFPHPGETVIGDTFHEGGGGKGSNQALAAAKLGAEVSFIGRIGDDAFGRYAIELYRSFGVSSGHITVDATIHSGVSVILIDKNGKNMIMVVPGANFHLSAADIDSAAELFSRSSIVGFQLENNFDLVEYGIIKAASCGAKVLLDPAPARPLPDSIFPSIWCVKPNEHEASIISGIDVVDRASAVTAGKWFLSKGVKVALITLGANGAVLVHGDGHEYFATPDFPATDTTGAGDCFSGAFMAGLSKGMGLSDAVRYANCAAAISVTRLGVIEAIPTPEEVDELYKRFGVEGASC